MDEVPVLRRVRLPQAAEDAISASAPSATSTSGCRSASGSSSSSTRAASRSSAARSSRSTCSRSPTRSPTPSGSPTPSARPGSREGVVYGTGDDRRSAARARRDGLRVHRRQHGQRRRRGDHARRRARARDALAADRDRRLGRRADAGGLRLADADGEDEPGDRAAARGGLLFVSCSPTRPTAASPPLRHCSATSSSPSRAATSASPGPR